MAEHLKSYKVRLHDQCADEQSDRPFVDAVVELRGTSIDIRIDGYGTREEVDECATPVFLEFYDGCLQLVVWDDINKSDPTIIKMENARITNRKED